jgi:hypothetical protein
MVCAAPTIALNELFGADRGGDATGIVLSGPLQRRLAGSNREVGVVPVLERLPYLFGDRQAPIAPAVTVIPGPGNVRLAWAYGAEPDLAGYRVYRSSTSGGPYQPIGPFVDRPAFLDASVPSGTIAYYVVRAFDTSGNMSEPSTEVPASPG